LKSGKGLEWNAQERKNYKKRQAEQRIVGAVIGGKGETIFERYLFLRSLPCRGKQGKQGDKARRSATKKKGFGKKKKKE